MKFSTASLYGLRAMIYLAEKNEVCSVKEIAEEKDISPYYLEKILSKLKDKKLLKSKKGKAGGYFLAYPAKKIKVGEIIRILEKEITTASCVSEENQQSCPHFKSCQARTIWRKIQKQINSVLNSITLADLIKK